MILLSEEDVLNSQGKKFNRETRGVDDEGSLFINIEAINLTSSSWVAVRSNIMSLELHFSNAFRRRSNLKVVLVNKNLIEKAPKA